MDKQEAYDFVKKVLDHIIIKADVSGLPEFYSADLIGHYGDLDFEFSDIENRVDYLNTVFHKRSHILHEVILADDKIVFRDRQITTHRETEEIWANEVTGVYSIRDGKISEVWLMTDQAIDYQETPEVGLEKSNPNDNDFGAKKHFEKFIADEQFSINGQLQSVQLTEREVDTLFLTMRGLTAKEIGQRLEISFRTVESYLETLKEKFDCNSKLELRRKVTPGAYWL